MSDRFDLEQEILRTWSIIEDLKLFNEQFEEMSEDTRQNYILGLITIYEQKFEKMWATFEELLKTDKLY